MNTVTTIVIMGVLAAALLGPVPAILERAAWARREPRAALVLWQAVGLTSGVAVLGTAMAVALVPLGDSLLVAGRTWVVNVAAGDLTGGLGPIHIVLLAFAVILTVRLAGILPITIWRTLQARRRHRDLVGLVSRPWPEARPGHGHVLEHPIAAVYCLPGRVVPGAPRVVFTTAALSTLDDGELAAVLAHEQAHLTERHDLVAMPFFAWVHAFPWFPGVRRSRSSVASLLEMVADDRATVDVDRATLASALARMGARASHQATPMGAIAIDGGSVLVRVRRLLEPPPRSWTWRVGAYLLSIGLVSVPINAFGASLWW